MIFSDGRIIMAHDDSAITSCTNEEVLSAFLFSWIAGAIAGAKRAHKSQFAADARRVATLPL
jgi:hypothetical protein